MYILPFTFNLIPISVPNCGSCRNAPCALS